MIKISTAGLPFIEEGGSPFAVWLCALHLGLHCPQVNRMFFYSPWKAVTAFVLEVGSCVNLSAVQSFGKNDRSFDPLCLQ